MIIREEIERPSRLGLRQALQQLKIALLHNLLYLGDGDEKLRSIG